MKVIEEGHVYELEDMEGADHTEDGQTLTFIKKVYQESTGELATIHNGTTNEEVLRVLIDRIKFLQAKMPCRENAIVITKLEECLMWLEKRTADRTARGVEGKHQA